MEDAGVLWLVVASLVMVGVCCVAVVVAGMSESGWLFLLTVLVVLLSLTGFVVCGLVGWEDGFC